MSLIRNSKKVSQSVDFSGIENGRIHPTDIDAVLEFNNDVLILIEVKELGVKMETGQRLAYERICNSWYTGKSVVLYVTHEHRDQNTDIPLNTCRVQGVYYKGEWKQRNEHLKTTLNKLGKYWNIDKLNFE